uniref:Uncharacterized protein n=1 Tax=viral metagenome TaxID=1070528 RepID=A0A6C0HV15_9ZZZZ
MIKLKNCIHYIILYYISGLGEPTVPPKTPSLKNGIYIVFDINLREPTVPLKPLP